MEKKLKEYLDEIKAQYGLHLDYSLKKGFLTFNIIEENFKGHSLIYSEKYGFTISSNILAIFEKMTEDEYDKERRVIIDIVNRLEDFIEYWE